MLATIRILFFSFLCQISTTWFKDNGSYVSSLKFVGTLLMLLQFRIYDLNTLRKVNDTILFVLLLNNEKQGTWLNNCILQDSAARAAYIHTSTGGRKSKTHTEKHALSTHAMHARVAIRTESI